MFSTRKRKEGNPAVPGEGAWTCELCHGDGSSDASIERKKRAVMTAAMEMWKYSPIQLELDLAWVMENYIFAGTGDRPGTWEFCLLRVSQTWRRQEVGIFSEDRPIINMVRVCGGNDSTSGYDGVYVERAGGGMD